MNSLSPDLEPVSLATLANSLEWIIRAKVAAHPNTDAKTLEKLAYDAIAVVVCEVLMNRNTPEYIKECLIVRSYVIQTKIWPSYNLTRSNLH